jgi:NodT family efflux transporter outer membrane factor (OMF) lipoprotein
MFELRIPAVPLRLLALAAACLALGACAVGPDYVKPAFDAGTAFKEGKDEVPGWKPAQPNDHADRGAWWKIYGDPVLDGLMDRLNTSDQTIAQAEANYRQALALLQGARAGFFPTVTAGAGLTRSGGGGGGFQSGDASAGRSVSNSYSLTGNVSWEPDIWGKVRRSVESSEASAQASAADLAAARLSEQSSLAQTYFQLRVVDEQDRLLRATVDSYARSLQVTINRYNTGVSAKADVAVARTQLENTQAQQVDLAWQRGQFEHAIAILLGVPPAQFSLAPEPFTQQIPAIPVGLPSQLLERRPDVAGAERRTQQANAQIGVAVSAWFPDLTLSAGGGFSSSQLSRWLTVPARFWSIGPQLAETLFDGGLRESQVASARAAYDAQAAAYRLTALGALREVEDYMLQLQVMANEQVIQRRALDAARESLTLTRNQYDQGFVDYLSVATVQATALSTERTDITLMGSRLTASVQLIAALGGGWDGNVNPPAPTPAPQASATPATSTTTPTSPVAAP